MSKTAPMVARAFASLLVLALLTGLPTISDPAAASQPPVGAAAAIRQATYRSLGQGVRSAGKYRVTGRVRAAGAPLVNSHVVAHRAGSTPKGSLVIGRARTDNSGRFTLHSRRTTSADVVYLTASGGKRLGRAVPSGFELATGIGRNRPRTVQLNELTTVAVGFSMAQFLDGGSVGGANPGLANAAAMARNLVNPASGRVSDLMGKAPNGARTATLATLNTLADVIASCATSGFTCDRLIQLATPVGGSAPGTSLQAMADIAANPSNNAQSIFNLQRGSAVYKPRLKKAPGSWILAIKFVGNGHQFDGPGNMAFDANGDVWTTVNYQNAVKPKNVCASKTLVKLRPYSKTATVDTYRGGGLNGAGFGIGIDPNGRVWVGNFGFKGSKCEATPTSNSVSVFSPAGKPLSGPSGITAGGISWPQGTVSDRGGNIWIANCGNNTVTRFAGGDPGRSSILSGGISAMGKPFDIVIDRFGNSWVTSSATNQVFAFDSQGSPLVGSPYSGGGLSKPLGIATDSLGNQWVANSAVIDLPCSSAPPTTSTSASAPTSSPSGSPGGTITGVSATGQTTQFSGGGLTIPWGIATDGDDNVWVANFGGKRVSRFCGARANSCPPGVAVGQPISPASGYGFNGLQRNTGVQIDASGNVWLCNNWKEIPLQTNPGGDGLVVFVGAAPPVQMPLIGPPQQP